MNIKMIGIDHGTAPVEIRQIFAYTKKSMGEALAWLKEQKQIFGCVLLSTCNRMELWVSCKKEEELDLLELLCQQRQEPKGFYEPYFQERKGHGAVEHLFRLASGLESRILGEDQILTQVKEALSFARERDCVDGVLEVLFRRAVTAGKMVKTQAPIQRANYSVIDKALEFLRERHCRLEGECCMVIGNGEMGRLAAQALMAEGAKVWTTVREYHSGVVQIPKGCQRIGYSGRYEEMSRCKLIVSATASPNYTITREDLEEKRENLQIEGEQIFLDLAMPPDIDPRVADLPGLLRFDIDDFQTEVCSEDMKRQIGQAEKLLQGQLEEFYTWYECQDLVPRIQELSSRAGRDAVWRTGKAVKGLGLDEDERKNLENRIEESAAKVVGRLLFGLRDSMKGEDLRACLEVFEQIYPQEDV